MLVRRPRHGKSGGYRLFTRAHWKETVHQPGRGHAEPLWLCSEHTHVAGLRKQKQSGPKGMDSLAPRSMARNPEGRGASTGLDTPHGDAGSGDV